MKKLLIISTTALLVMLLAIAHIPQEQVYRFINQAYSQGITELEGLTGNTGNEDIEWGVCPFPGGCIRGDAKGEGIGQKGDTWAARIEGELLQYGRSHLRGDHNCASAIVVRTWTIHHALLPGV